MRSFVLPVLCSLLLFGCKATNDTNRAALTIDAVRLGADRSLFGENKGAGEGPGAPSVVCQLHYEAGNFRQYDVFAKNNPAITYLVQFQGDRCQSVSTSFQPPVDRDDALRVMHQLLPDGQANLTSNDQDDLIKKDVKHACEFFTFSSGAEADVYYAPNSSQQVERLEVAITP